MTTAPAYQPDRSMRFESSPFSQQSQANANFGMPRQASQRKSPSISPINTDNEHAANQNDRSNSNPLASPPPEKQAEAVEKVEPVP